MKFIDGDFEFDLKLKTLIAWETKIDDENEFNLIFGALLGNLFKI